MTKEMVVKRYNNETRYGRGLRKMKEQGYEVVDARKEELRFSIGEKILRFCLLTITCGLAIIWLPRKNTKVWHVTYQYVGN